MSEKKSGAGKKKTAARPSQSARRRRRTHRNPSEEHGTGQGAPGPVLPALDPLGPYRDPVPKRWNSRSEEFRVWMHSARGWIYALMLIAITAPLFYSLGALNAPGFSDILNSYFSGQGNAGAAGRLEPSGYSTTEGSRDTRIVYSVGNLHRSQDEILSTASAIRAFGLKPGAANLESGSPPFRAFVRNEHRTDLLVHAALNEGLLQKKDFSVYIHHAFRRLVARAYVIYSLRESPGKKWEDSAPETSEEFRNDLSQRISEEQMKELEKEDIERLYRASQANRWRRRIEQRRALLIYREKQRLKDRAR
ncbi:MAG: hypothetical protein KDK25_01850 [Leptospiraceae bacterium]|nr:hypothetical protein [Leptospiraceae bacterium]